MKTGEEEIENALGRKMRWSERIVWALLNFGDDLFGDEEKEEEEKKEEKEEVFDQF